MTVPAARPRPSRSRAASPPRTLALVPAMLLALLPVGSASASTPMSPEEGPAACARAFEFVRQDAARNYAGFPDKVTPATDGEYRRLVGRLEVASQGAADRKSCLSVLRQWTAFFHDEHLMVEPREPVTPEAAAALSGEVQVAFQRLDSKTVVLRLRSFGYEEMDAVRGLIASVTPMLERTENLIIDLRDNSGGSDFAWQGLLPLVYTNPIRGVAASLYSTPDNIARLERQAAEPSLDPTVRAWLANEVALMRAHPGEFVRQPDPVYRAERVLPYPKRVGVLVNRGCASSCEQLVLTLRQSRKVTIYGERTAGAVDYTNLVAATVPGGEYDLVYPVSRSQRLPGAPVDGRGLEPDVIVPVAESSPVDWVHQRLARRTAPLRRASELGEACSRSSILNDASRPECSGTGVSSSGSAAVGSRDPAGSSRALGCPSPERSVACDRSETYGPTCRCGR